MKMGQELTEKSAKDVHYTANVIPSILSLVNYYRDEATLESSK